MPIHQLADVMYVGIAVYVQGHPFEARDGKRCWLRWDVLQLQGL